MRHDGDSAYALAAAATRVHLARSLAAAEVLERLEGLGGGVAAALGAGLWVPPCRVGALFDGALPKAPVRRSRRSGVMQPVDVDGNANAAGRAGGGVRWCATITSGGAVEGEGWVGLGSSLQRAVRTAQHH